MFERAWPSRRNQIGVISELAQEIELKIRRWYGGKGTARDGAETILALVRQEGREESGQPAAHLQKLCGEG